MKDFAITVNRNSPSGMVGSISTKAFTNDHNYNEFFEWYMRHEFVLGDKLIQVGEMPKAKAFLIFLAMRREIGSVTEAFFDENNEVWNSKVTKGTFGLLYNSRALVILKSKKKLNVPGKVNLEDMQDDAQVELVKSLFSCADVNNLCNVSMKTRKMCTENDIYKLHAEKHGWKPTVTSSGDFARACSRARNAYIQLPGGTTIPYNEENSKQFILTTNDGVKYYVDQTKQLQMLQNNQL